MIVILAHTVKSKPFPNTSDDDGGCEHTNQWLDDVLTDRRGARYLLTPKHRYAVPVHNPNLNPENPDECNKHSKLPNIMRTLEFVNFINQLKC